MPGQNSKTTSAMTRFQLCENCYLAEARCAPDRLTGICMLGCDSCISPKQPPTMHTVWQSSAMSPEYLGPASDG